VPRAASQVDVVEADGEVGNHLQLGGRG
jgi:hypothetical protein